MKIHLSTYLNRNIFYEERNYLNYLNCKSYVGSLFLPFFLLNFFPSNNNVQNLSENQETRKYDCNTLPYLIVGGGVNWKYFENKFSLNAKFFDLRKLLLLTYRINKLAPNFTLFITLSSKFRISYLKYFLIKTMFVSFTENFAISKFFFSFS